MTTQVEQLTAAVAALTASINTSKTTLEAKAAEAANSAASASQVVAQVGDYSNKVATGAITLGLFDASFQLIDCNGAARDVNLPVLDLTKRCVFTIYNSSTTALAITPKSNGVAVGSSIAQGYSATVIWAGTKWVML